MNILFYSGYYKKPWSPESTEGTGGTEVAIIEISKRLSYFGWNVFVSGNVEEGEWNGVKWIPTEKLHEDYFDKFDVIIGVSYIHFILEFSKYRAKKIFWVHNTDYHPWYNGEEILESDTLLNSGDIHKIVCLTKWHKQQWSQKYSIDTGDIKIIGNGINPNKFYTSSKKVKNRFIWSSSPERGLDELLENWVKIKERISSATLHVYSPPYSRINEEHYSHLFLEGVEFKGSVSQEILHKAMLDAEYWVYLTEYEETYCITALEMQKSRVIPITTNVAALSETVNSGIILDPDKTKWNLGIELIVNVGPEIKKKVLDSNENWVKLQTWNNRSYDWKKLIEECK